jgi:hypothetical protein
MRKEKQMSIDMGKFAGGGFIGVADLNGGTRRETISAVELGKYGKPDLHFRSGDKLSVNSTNAKALSKAYGRNSDDWIGREIELYCGQVVYNKQTQASVLARPVSPVIPDAQRSAPPPSDDGYEYPF